MTWTHLHAAIMGLDHSGSNGFEGLVADLLSAVTGTPFTTQKSGSQHGTDALASTFRIGVEGKRYGESTRLPLDALKAKLIDAATSQPDLELWILATTRSIDPNDKRSLDDLGDSHGVATLVISWDVGAFLIPPLALLCAMAPQAALAHFQNDPQVARDLAGIAAEQGFDWQSQQLRDQLNRADIGYGAARAALISWNRVQMADANCARLAFDSEADLLASGRRRIGRPSVSAAIDAWWSTSTPSAVILGEEGMGKTWAALGWWTDRSAEADTPLCVILPARKVDSEDGPILVSRALHRATGLRDTAFWERRLARWLTTPGTACPILVIIDGLNQKWSFTQWSQLILSLAAGAWEGRSRVLMTCRPDHWRGKLRELADLTPPPLPIPVGPFDDAELDSLLQSYSVTKEWDPDIKELIRVPRLCHVAIKRHDELAATGDVTVERLVYEDWRHRSATARAAWSELEFQDFIVGLATRLRDAAPDEAQTRAELIARVSESAGDGTTEAPMVLSEIIDGGWMEPTSRPHLLRVRKSRVAPVLGLALVAELSNLTDAEAVEVTTAAALEPYQGNDISVSILRYATTFALMKNDAPDSVRKVLLTRWLAAHNFGSRDFVALWPLIGANPSVVLDCVEELWFGPHPQGHEDEVIVKGFANAVRWPVVAEALDERLTDWLSRYWLDPLVGAVLGQVDDDDEAKIRRAATEQRAASWVAAGGAEATGITPILTNGASWGRARATELLSWLPRARFTRALKSWAVTTAIIGRPTPVERMGWTLRWNEVDCEDAEAAVLRLAEGLAAHGHPVSVDASKQLLAALATPAAMAALVEEGDEAKTARERWNGVELDGQTIRWNFAETREWPRTRTAPLDAALGLAAFAPDQDLVLGDAEIAQLSDLARQARELDNEETRARSIANRDTDELALARWAPNDLAALVRQRLAFREPPTPTVGEPEVGFGRPGWLTRLLAWVASTLSPTQVQDTQLELGAGGGQRNLADTIDLEDGATLLGPAELSPWRDFAHEQRTNLGVASNLAKGLHSATLLGLSAAEQVSALLEWPSGPPSSIDLHRTLEKFSPAEFAAIAPQLTASAPEEQLLNWLALLDHMDLSGLPPGWEVLVTLFQHSSPDVRALAMQVALSADDISLADALEVNGWSCPVTERPHDAGSEGAYGSLLLAKSTKASFDAAIADRVHGEVLGTLAKRYPGQPSYLDRFATYVEAELEFWMTTRSGSFPRGLLTHVDGWDLLAEEQPDRLQAAVDPLVKRTAQPLAFFMMDRFPIYDAIDALATIDPAAAAEIITRALSDQLSSNMRSGDLSAAAMRLPTPEGDAARDLLLGDANTDAKLKELVASAERHEQLPWVLACIERDLGAPCAGMVARGMALAAFLPLGHAGETLWGTRLSTSPASGWLAGVHEVARARFARQRQARHWFEAFTGAEDPVSAYAALRLFTAAIDGRVYASDVLRPSEEVLRAWPAYKRAHWHWNWKYVKAAVKKDEDQLKRTLLFGSLPGHAQYPKVR